MEAECFAETLVVMFTVCQHILLHIWTFVCVYIHRTDKPTVMWYRLVIATFVTNEETLETDLDDWLTVHRSITLVDLQLDAQNSYLFTYNTFIKIIYMFRALPCSSSGGLGRNFIYDDTRGCICTVTT